MQLHGHTPTNGNDGELLDITVRSSNTRCSDVNLGKLDKEHLDFCITATVRLIVCSPCTFAFVSVQLLSWFLKLRDCVVLKTRTFVQCIAGTYTFFRYIQLCNEYPLSLLSLCLSVCVSLSVSLCLSLCLSVSVCLCVSLCLSMSLFVSLSLSLCLSVCVSLCVSLYLSLCLSVSVSLSLIDCCYLCCMFCVMTSY